MENSGFYDDNYGGGSSDDDLVDLSAPAQDLLHDLPFDKQDYSQGMTCITEHLFHFICNIFFEGFFGLCYTLNVNGKNMACIKSGAIVGALRGTVSDDLLENCTL